MFKYVHEWCPEICNICYKEKYGYFAIENDNQICFDCLDQLGRTYNMIEDDKSGIHPFRR